MFSSPVGDALRGVLINLIKGMFGYRLLLKTIVKQFLNM